jgi:hypothetical protein
MADGTSEITVDTGEWWYVDSTGIRHHVTNGETFNMTVSDDGADDVQYNIPVAQTVATDDGYVVTFRPQTASAGSSALFLQIETLSDTIPSQGFQQYRGGISGEIPMSISTDNVIQIWRVTKLTPSDTDNAGGSPTIACEFEDQFGNTMLWKAGMTVGVAA